MMKRWWAVLAVFVMAVAAVPAVAVVVAPGSATGDSFHIDSGGSPFVSVGSGYGTFTIAATSGDTLIVFEWDTQLTPSDSQGNTFHDVENGVGGLVAIWNTTLTATDTDTVTIHTGDPSSYAGWGVTVAGGAAGRTLASGTNSGYSAMPSSQSVNAIAIFVSSQHTGSCSTSGGTAWDVIPACLTLANFYIGSFSQNVTALTTPELSVNASGGTLDDWAWMEIPAPVVSGPTQPLAVAATSVSDAAITLNWDNPPGTLTDNYVLVYSGGVCAGSPVDTDNAGSVVTTYEVTALTALTPYSFQVEAADASGIGAASNCAATVTLPDISDPYLLAERTNVSFGGNVTVLSMPIDVYEGSAVLVINTEQESAPNDCAGLMAGWTVDQSWGGTMGFNACVQTGASVNFDYVLDGYPSSNGTYSLSIHPAGTNPYIVTGVSVADVAGPEGVAGIATGDGTGSAQTTTVCLQDGCSSDTGPGTYLVDVASAADSNYEQVTNTLATSLGYGSSVLYTLAGGFSGAYAMHIGFDSCVAASPGPTNANGSTNVDSSGRWSMLSLQFSALSGPCVPQAPPAPTGVSVSDITYTTATVGWTQSAGGGILNNTVFVYSGASCGHLLHAYSTGGAATSLGLTGLTEATTYSVTVAGWNSTGMSPLSSCVSFTTLTPPSLTIENVNATQFTAVYSNGSWTNATAIFLVIYNAPGPCAAGALTDGAWTKSAALGTVSYIPTPGFVTYQWNLTTSSSSGFASGQVIWVGLEVKVSASHFTFSCQQVTFTTPPPPPPPASSIDWIPLIIVTILAVSMFSFLYYNEIRKRRRGDR
jgi:hypothetical protein